MTVEGVPGQDLERVEIAAAAAAAARAVPGVVRLQPGLTGLLKHFAGQAWERATGRPAPDAAGIEVELEADRPLRVDARIVTAVHYPAAEVGAAVHAAIATAVRTTTGREATVHVRIVEIDL